MDLQVVSEGQHPFFQVTPSEIGLFSYVGEFSHISQMVKIGKFCSIGNLCTIGATQHNLKGLTSYPFRENYAAVPVPETLIGNDVWIGCNAVVMAGLTVGDGASIGAGSIVTKNVPPYSIVIGNPARILKMRFPQHTIEALLKSRWWDWPLEKLKNLPCLDIDRCVELLTS